MGAGGDFDSPMAKGSSAMLYPKLIEADSMERRNFFKTNKYHFLQILVALGAGLSLLAPGMSMGFSAVSIPQLQIPDKRLGPLPQRSTPSTLQKVPAEDYVGAKSKPAEGKLVLTHDEATWFMSVTMITTPLGCLLSGFLTDKCGRKGALLFVAVPGLMGWMLLATVPLSVTASTSVLVQMILGRIMNGIAIGLAAAPGTILAAECSAPCLRGAVLCINSLAIAAGALLVYFLGDVMPGWRMVAAIGAILTGFVALITLTLPESPVWLRSRGRFGDADWVCSQLGLRTVDRGSYLRARERLQREIRIYPTCGGKNRCLQYFSGVQDTFFLLLEPRTLKPLLLVGGIFFFQQAAGVFVVMFNVVELAAWSGIRGAVVNGNMTAVLIGICTLAVVAVVCVFIDRWGRRPAVIFSGIGMAISMTVLAAYVYFTVADPKPEVYKHYRPFLTSNYSRKYYFKYKYHLPSTPYPSESNDLLAEEDSPWHTCIPLAALLSWAASAALGFVPLPWALPAELLPVQTRGIGTGILSAIAYTFGFMALRIFSASLLTVPLSACLFAMAVFAAAGAIYVAALLPETRGLAIDGLEEKKGKWKEVSSSLNKPMSDSENESDGNNV